MDERRDQHDPAELIASAAEQVVDYDRSSQAVRDDVTRLRHVGETKADERSEAVGVVGEVQPHSGADAVVVSAGAR